MERVLDACVDELRQSPLVDEFCMVDGACAALVGDYMRRAVIRMKGKKEVQVYLVDLGRTQFLSRGHVFLLPKNVANMAPPLAHYCSLADVDGRQLDQTTVRRFMEKVVHKGELLLRGRLSRLFSWKRTRFSTRDTPSYVRRAGGHPTREEEVVLPGRDGLAQDRARYLTVIFF